MAGWADRAAAAVVDAIEVTTLQSDPLRAIAELNEQLRVLVAARRRASIVSHRAARLDALIARCTALKATAARLVEARG